MNSLIAICESLSVGETKLVQHFYKIRVNDDNLKRGKLFEILLVREVVEDKDAALHLGYPDAGSSFQNLKQRLKADIMSILLMQECTAKFCTPYAQALFECRRSLMQGEILMSRGVYDEAIEILLKAIKIASKFQLYAEQLQIEDLLRNHTCVKGNITDIRTADKSIASNYKMLGAVLEAKKKHYEITNPLLMNVKTFDDYLGKGGQALGQLSAISDPTPSSRIKMYRDLAAIHFYSSTHEFAQAEKHALSLLDTFENDPVVSSRSNKAGANMELAGIFLHTKKYDRAIQHATEALSLFKPGMINHLNAHIILFFSYFRNNQVSEASEILKQAQNHRMIRIQKDKKMQSRIHLLNAAVSFRNGDIDRSSYILNRNMETSRDKEEWMPGYYMLDLLILMEKKNADLANYRLEAFRKMLKRYGIDKQELRLAAITRILKNLVKQDCSFRNIVPAHAAEIKMLSEAKEKYYWNPAGYEVIRFDEWLLKKVS